MATLTVAVISKKALEIGIMRGEGAEAGAGEMTGVGAGVEEGVGGGVEAGTESGVTHSKGERRRGSLLWGENDRADTTSKGTRSDDDMFRRHDYLSKGHRGRGECL